MDYMTIKTIEIPLVGSLKPIDYMTIENPCNIPLKTYSDSSLPEQREVVSKMWKIVFSCVTDKQLDSVENILKFGSFNYDLVSRIQFLIEKKRQEIKENK